MKGFLKLSVVICFCGALLSCAGQPVSDEGEVVDDSVQSADSGSEIDSEEDLLADEGEGGGDSSNKAAKLDDSGDADLSDASSSGNLEDEFDNLDKDLDKEQKMATGSEAPEDDLLNQPESSPQDTQDPQVEIVAETKSSKDEIPPSVSEASDDPLLDLSKEDPSSVVTKPIAEDASKASPPPAPSPSNRRVEITNIKFEGNEGGGAIVIEGSQALEYSSRMNPQSNQYVVEVANAYLPSRLKRPFITKDFPSSVGSIDAYQTPGSDTVRVVVQLRDGAGEPTSQKEGSSIIIIPPGGGISEDSKVASGETPSMDAASPKLPKGGILSSKNLETFLSGNMKYFGKKISIQVKDIDVREAISLIAEESGANLVMSEGVSGTLSLKLKNVPWDQALVLILKSKKLGYTRQGNVLRISPMDEIKKEEEDAMKLVESRRKVETLKVQMIPINYAKIADLQTQIKPIISERGSLVADSRTNSLILTETEEVLERARKIISSLDIAPAQVLIEGKLVEARESFNKRMGIQWDIAGAPLALGQGPNGPVNMLPNLSVRPGVLAGGSLGFSLSLGTLDILGDLNAVLTLEEQEENVRVISSPRIVTLHNEEAKINQTATVSVLASENKKDGSKTYKDLPLKMELRVKPEVANNGVVQMEVDIAREFLGALRSDGSAGSHTRSAKTKVMVKSGQTAVIGGIYQNDASQLDTGVPFLKDIPILGYFFRSGNFHKDKTELLLFLTPRVLSQAGGSLVSQNADGATDTGAESAKEDGEDLNLE